MSNKMIAFGPVPSRRLGQSLGINNIPPKICTYTWNKLIETEYGNQKFYMRKLPDSKRDIESD